MAVNTMSKYTSEDIKHHAIYSNGNVHRLKMRTKNALKRMNERLRKGRSSSSKKELESNYKPGGVLKRQYPTPALKLVGLQSKMVHLDVL